MPEDLWVAVCSKLDTDGDGMLQVGEFMKEMKNAVADTSVGLAPSTSGWRRVDRQLKAFRVLRRVV